MGRKRRNSSDEESKKENQVDKATALKNAATANSRERARMQVLSKAFVKLKTTLPWVPPDTKLSKLDTLRLATSYIAHLRQILADDDAAASAMGGGGGPGSAGHSPGADPAGDSDGGGSSGDSSSTPGEPATRSPQPGSAAGVHPINFTWPYSFHGKVTATHPDACLRSPERPDAHAPTAKLPSLSTLST